MIITHTYIAQYCNKTHPKKKMWLKTCQKHKKTKQQFSQAFNQTGYVQKEKKFMRVQRMVWRSNYGLPDDQRATDWPRKRYGWLNIVGVPNFFYFNYDQIL